MLQGAYEFSIVITVNWLQSTLNVLCGGVACMRWILFNESDHFACISQFHVWMRTQLKFKLIHTQCVHLPKENQQNGHARMIATAKNGGYRGGVLKVAIATRQLNTVWYHTTNGDTEIVVFSPRVTFLWIQIKTKRWHRVHGTRHTAVCVIRMRVEWERD